MCYHLWIVQIFVRLAVILAKNSANKKEDSRTKRR